MAKLTYEDCPDVSSKRIDAINDLTIEQLIVEIEKGPNSLFKKSLPVLKLALRKRQDERDSEKRSEDLEIAKEANKISFLALRQSEIANEKSDQTRIWAAIAVLVTVVIAAIGWLR